VRLPAQRSAKPPGSGQRLSIPNPDLRDQRGRYCRVQTDRPGTSEPPRVEASCRRTPPTADPVLQLAGLDALSGHPAVRLTFECLLELCCRRLRSRSLAPAPGPLQQARPVKSAAPRETRS
jgi:hypothetical protein